MKTLTNEIKALTFDVGGTVFDWQTAVRSKVTAIAEVRGRTIDAPQFALDWRLRFFQVLAEVRRGERDWCSADVVQLASLNDISDRYPTLELSETDMQDLVRVWHEMNAWTDFPPALARLRTQYRVIVLTVLSFAIVVDSSRHSGISWDGILSGEFMGHYKPNTEAYLEAAERLMLTPGEIMMVAAHPGDLRASMTAGFRTAYVQPKLDEPFGFDDKDPSDFDIQANDFTDLAYKLGV